MDLKIHDAAFEGMGSPQQPRKKLEPIEPSSVG